MVRELLRRATGTQIGPPTLPTEGQARPSFCAVAPFSLSIAQRIECTPPTDTTVSASRSISSGRAWSFPRPAVRASRRRASAPLGSAGCKRRGRKRRAGQAESPQAHQVREPKLEKLTLFYKGNTAQSPYVLETVSSSTGQVGFTYRQRRLFKTLSELAIG